MVWIPRISHNYYNDDTRTASALYRISEKMSQNTSALKESNEDLRREIRNSNDISKAQLEFEKNTRDRVDISKMEYLNLLKENKSLKSELDCYKSAYMELIRPILNNLEISEDIKRKLFEGKADNYKTDVTFFKEPRDMSVSIVVRNAYKVKDDKYGY